MNNQQLYGLKQNIIRAREHLRNLYTHIKDSLEVPPCEIFTDAWPGEGEGCMKVRSTCAPPSMIAVIYPLEEIMIFDVKIN